MLHDLIVQQFWELVTTVVHIRQRVGLDLSRDVNLVDAAQSMVDVVTDYDGAFVIKVQEVLVAYGDAVVAYCSFPHVNERLAAVYIHYAFLVGGSVILIQYRQVAIYDNLNI